MPTVRFPNEAETVAQGAGVRSDAERVVNNLALAEHMGKFVSGQLVTHFGNEDLGQMINTKDQVAITISWG